MNRNEEGLEEDEICGAGWGNSREGLKHKELNSSCGSAPVQRSSETICPFICSAGERERT